MSLFHKLGLIVSIYTEFFVLTAMCLLEKKKSVSWYHQHLSRLLHVTHSMESLVFIFNLMSVWQKLLRQAVTLCPPTGLGCPGEHWAADTARTGGSAPPSLEPAWNNFSFAVGTEKFSSMYYFSQKITLFTLSPTSLLWQTYKKRLTLHLSDDGESSAPVKKEELDSK